MKFKVLDKLIMLSKLTIKGIILQCLLINVILAADLSAQDIKSVTDVRIDMNVKDASLSELFNYIESTTNFYFSFSAEDIGNDFSYSNSRKKVTVREVLLDVSEKANLKFKQVNRNIIVQKNTSNPQVKPNIEVIIQGITITGKVNSVEDNAGLPGANVIVKGTSTGTVTDIDGNYVIEVPDQNAILVFSSVGYVTQEVAVGNQAVINLTMTADVTALDEIVVVGYGEQKKVTVTGAVVDVKGDELVRSPAVDMTNSIAGRMPGVVAIQASGEPGYDGSLIKIRGSNTWGNSSPLIVIDGIPDRDGGFGRLTPQDVESISVLKDASAAIYGARAANGAIIITTKKGATGKPTVSFDMNFGWAQPTSVPQMSNAVEYANIMNELPIYRQIPVNEWQTAWQSIQSTGVYNSPTPGVNPLSANYSPDAIAKHASGTDPWGYPDTDWFGDAFKTWAPQSRYNFMLSGGAPKVKYMASLGYVYQDAIYNNSATYYKQYNGRLNLEAEVNDFVKTNFGLMFRREDRNYPTESAGAIFRMLMRGRPTEPEVWPNGKPGPDIENGQNPYVITTNATGYQNNPTDFIQSNASIVITQPWIEGLKLTLSGAADIRNDYNKRWQTPWELYYWDRLTYEDDGVTPLLTSAVRSNFNDPRLTESNERRLNTNLTALLNYDRTFGGGHTLSILAGATRENFTGNNYFAFRRFFLSTAVDQLFAGGTEQQNTGGSGYEIARMGYYGRFQYNYKEKYLAEFIWRYDGSDWFPLENAQGDQKRFGFFPGILLGWNMTNENWFNVSAIDYMKLRGSVGQMGNELIYLRGQPQRYAYLSTYSFNEYPINSIVEKTLYETLLANDNFTWERATNFNIGLDATLFAGRLDMTLEYFYNNRGDILIDNLSSTPTSSGISNLLPPVNEGKLINRGFEFALNYNHASNAVRWDAGINGGYAMNEVVNWDDVPGIPEYQLKKGKQVNSYLVYQSDGVFQNQEEIAAETLDYSGVTNQLIPGDMKIKDYNGDGVINADDRVRINNNIEPTFNFGATFNMYWKRFDLNVLFQGATGAKMRIYTESGDIGNFLKYDHDNRWTIDNPSSEHPRLASRGDTYYTGGNFGQNTYFLFSKDYVRLKNLEIGYNIPFQNTNAIQKLRLFFNGLNLLTFAANDIYDPEGTAGSGVFYPQSRVLNVGLSATF